MGCEGGREGRGVGAVDIVDVGFAVLVLFIFFFVVFVLQASFLELRRRALVEGGQYIHTYIEFAFLLSDFNMGEGGGRVMKAYICMF